MIPNQASATINLQAYESQASHAARPKATNQAEKQMKSKLNLTIH